MAVGFWLRDRLRSATTVCLVLMVGLDRYPGPQHSIETGSSQRDPHGNALHNFPVKFPVALSGGSNANSNPLAGEGYPRVP